MAKQRPLLAADQGRQPTKVPRAKPTGDEPSRWVFSFQYWKQIKYFGLSERGTTWFVSLLERLVTLSGMPVDAFLGNPATRDSYHYHNVVWNLRNIPIQRHHLDWLPPDYRENEEEYPFVQFSLTQSLGRVVGFWGANKQIFYVVLLDPEHNIWPTESRGYRVDNCWPIATDYERVISAIDAASRLTCEHPNCPFPEAIRNLPTGYDDHRVARLRLTATLWDDFSCLTQYDTNITPDVVFETGIYATLDRLSPTNGGDASRETLVRTVEPANEAEAIEIA